MDANYTPNRAHRTKESLVCFHLMGATGLAVTCMHLAVGLVSQPEH